MEPTMRTPITTRAPTMLALAAAGVVVAVVAVTGAATSEADELATALGGSETDASGGVTLGVVESGALWLGCAAVVAVVPGLVVAGLAVVGAGAGAVVAGTFLGGATPGAT
jgi:hypothetical protein